MDFAPLFPAEAVMPHLDSASKKQALRAMAVRAADITGLDVADIFSVLLEREQAGSTGVGDRAAIPHGRMEGLGGIYVSFATLTQPVEFGAMDGLPVDILFLLLTPAQANTEHLKAMAIVSRLLRDKELMDALRRESDVAAVHARLMARIGNA